MANANNNNIPFQQFNQNPMAQFLPQPQGNVYLINSSNEITLVPVGAVGVSVAICMTEGVMYLKTMQNGNPMLLRYKLNSLDIPVPTNYIQEQPSNNINEDKGFTNILKNYDERIKQLESLVNKLQLTKNDTPQNKQVNSSRQGGKEWPL